VVAAGLFQRDASVATFYLVPFQGAVAGVIEVEGLVSAVDEGRVRHRGTFGAVDVDA